MDRQVPNKTVGAGSLSQTAPYDLSFGELQ